MNIPRIITFLRSPRSAGGAQHAVGRGILLAACVGIIAGIGAIAFHLLCGIVTGYGLEWLAGYYQGGPRNESDVRDVLPFIPVPSAQLIPWLIVLLPAFGGLISGVLVYWFAPEAGGHGTDAAIRAFHRQRGYVRWQVPLIKMVTSAITLGTGGSGGREGPIAQIGAGFGSFLATRLGLSDKERRILMAAGLGAGIGAIFHAPLAGAIFAIEVLYRDPDFEAEALIPAFISTTVSYSVFCSFFGFGAFEPLFNVAADLTGIEPLQLLGPLAVLALTMALASWLYVTCFYGAGTIFSRLNLPQWFKPVVGAGLTGMVALALYYAFAFIEPHNPQAQHDSLSVLSFGYGFLQKILNMETASIGIPLLLAVGLGKILTTSLTIGSGGSGGVFGPSMVIGGSLGAVVGLVFHQIAPGIVAEDQVVIFAILGMASFFAAAANTPVSTLIIVSELTNSYALLLPSMWVCALAYLSSGGWTLFREQVNSRLDSPAHRGDFIIDILQGMSVRQTLVEANRKFITVNLDTPMTELARMITSTLQSSFPVMDQDGNYRGLFSLNDIRQFLYDSDLGPLAVAQDLATEGIEPLTTSMDLSEALSRFAQSRFDELPVVEEDEPGKVVAMLRRQDIISVYNRRLLDMRTEE